MTELKYPDISAQIIDFIIANPQCNYAFIHARHGREHHWKLGRALHQLIEMGVVTRSGAGRYSLSTSSEQALAA